MKVYYAHPMSWYGTEREEDDIDCIQRETPLASTVVNPNSEDFQTQVETLKQEGQESHIMGIFTAAVVECDALAYRTFDDDKISAGVAQEILTAALHGKQIFRLMDLNKNNKPKLFEQRGIRAAFGPNVLTIAETRDRIKRGVM